MRVRVTGIPLPETATSLKDMSKLASLSWPLTLIVSETWVMNPPSLLAVMRRV